MELEYGSIEEMETLSTLSTFILFSVLYQEEDNS